MLVVELTPGVVVLGVMETCVGVPLTIVNAWVPHSVVPLTAEMVSGPVVSPPKYAIPVVFPFVMPRLYV